MRRPGCLKSRKPLWRNGVHDTRGPRTGMGATRVQLRSWVRPTSRQRWVIANRRAALVNV